MTRRLTLVVLTIVPTAGSRVIAPTSMSPLGRRSVAASLPPSNMLINVQMRHLFGMGGSGGSHHHSIQWGPHESRRHNVYYEDPGSGRRATTMGKPYRSKEMAYMDRASGREVDARGRPIYTV
jgi:hypothetical protein